MRTAHSLLAVLIVSLGCGVPQTGVRISARRPVTGTAGTIRSSPVPIVTSTRPFGSIPPALSAPTWIDLADPSAPPASLDGTMVFDSARRVLVLFGGLQGCGFTNETWEWNGRSWAQRTVNGAAGSPPARYGHVMVYDSRRSVSVMFGGTGDSGELNDTWEWNGTTWTQAEPQTAPPARVQAAAAFDSTRGVTVLFGGSWGSGALNDTWEWDGAQWTQRTPATSPVSTVGAGAGAMVFDSTRNVSVLFTGLATWTWDGTGWTQQSPATTPPAGGEMVFDSTRRLTVLYGGGSGSDTWEWDGANWAEASPAVIPPGGPIAFDPVGGVTVMQAAAGLWKWNGTNWIQATGPGVQTPAARSWHAMAFDSRRGETVLFGGAVDNVMDDTWEWNGSAWTQRTPAVSAPARALHAMAYDSRRGVTVLFGGCGTASTSCNELLNDTWEWDGSAWTEQRPSLSPPGREGHAMVYDSNRGVTVLFGGTGAAGDLSDTWEWDGTSWTERNPAASPGARNFHAMAYDAARGVTVMFGGATDQQSVLGDTWAWDGTSWSQIFVATGPSERVEATMAYDSVRRVTVLFGGSAMDFGPDNDTWEWNGSAWTLDEPANSPPGRTQHAMVYDSARRVPLVFGGDDGFESLYDTWEYQGD